MVKIYNKRAVVFPYLMSLFIIVILFTSLTFFIHGSRSDLQATDYGNLIKNADIQQMVGVSYSYTFDNLIERIYLESRNDFLENVIVNSQNNVLECFEDDEVILFDKRVDLENRVNSNCFNTEILDNYDELFSDILNQRLNKILFETTQNLNGFEVNSDISYDEELFLLGLNISYDLDFSSNIARGHFTKENSYSFELSSYFNLLDSLFEEIPKLDSMENEISSCISSGESKNMCIEKIHLKFMEENLNEDFIYEVEFLGNVEDDYIKVKYDIYLQDLSKNKLLSFVSIYEDFAFFDYANFTLKQPIFDQRVLQIDIEEENFNMDEFGGYLILYSYDNFFEDEKYDDVEESLINGKLTDFNVENKIEINDYEGISYDLFDVEDVSFDLTGAFIKKGFSYEQGILSVYLNQIFSKNQNSFELFKDEEIYVFVFPLREKNSQYFSLVDKEYLQDNITSMEPSTLAPLDLDSFSLSNVDDISGIDYGLNISFDNNFDEENNFDTLTYYFSTQSNFVSENCQDSSSDCFYKKFENVGDLSLEDEINLLFYSLNDSGSLGNNNFDLILNDEELSNLELSDNLNLYVSVIAESSDRRGYFQTYELRNEYVFNEDNRVSFYEINSLDTTYTLRPIVESIRLMEVIR